MSEKVKGKQTFEIIFTRASDYQVIPATGAWGGLSPSGEVVFDLYVEKRQNPERLEIETIEGKLTKETRHPDPQPFIREAQIGVVLRPDIAKVIGEFLIDLADKAKASIEKKEAGK